MKLKKMNLLFILVPLLLIALFKLYPVLIAIVESFFTGRIGEDRIFSGFSNYANMFSDPVFWKSLNSTLIFLYQSYSDYSSDYFSPHAKYKI